ncbi:MAG TPA: hypothetical protein VIF57_02910, partial [Polyangia bacterium]
GPGGAGGAPTASGGSAATGHGGGTGGRATGAGGSSATSPFAFVTDAGTPPNLAVNASYLFWANTNRRALMKIRVDGTSPGMMVAPLMTPNTWVAADAQNVYWNGGIPGSPIGILKVGNDGGVMPTFLTNETDELRGIAVNSNGVYWSTSVGAVTRAGLDGSARLVLVPSGFVSNLVVDEQSVYWVGDCGMAGPTGCQSINKVASWGGAPVEIFRGQGITGLAVDAMFVYWSDRLAAAVMRSALDGAAPAFAFPFPVNATSLAVDPAGIYWISPMGVVFAALPGTTMQRALGDSGGLPASALALGATNVYWLATGSVPSGTIMKAPK